MNRKPLSNLEVARSWRAPDCRRGGRDGPRREARRALRPPQGQGRARCAGERHAQGQPRAGHRDDPTAAGEGKTTTTVGIGQAFAPSGQAGAGGATRAVARPGVRRQGRRLRGGRSQVLPMEENQPLLQRRSLRGVRRRTTCSPRWSTTKIYFWQRPRPRSARGGVAPHGRHERPVAAQGGGWSGRHTSGVPRRGTASTSWRLRDHGNPLFWPTTWPT